MRMVKKNEWNLALQIFDTVLKARNPSNILEFITEYSSGSGGLPIMIILEHVIESTTDENLLKELRHSLEENRKFYKDIYEG